MRCGSRANFDLDAYLQEPFDLDSELGLYHSASPTSPLWGAPSGASFRSKAAAASAARAALRALVGSAYVPVTKKGLIATTTRLEIAYEKLSERNQEAKEDVYERGILALYFLYGKAT